MKLAPRAISLASAALIALVPGGGRADEAAFLAAGQATLASEIESGLPEVPIDEWLSGLVARGSPIRWEVHDCGEQSGTPDSGGDLPLCVELETHAPGRGGVFLYFQVGTKHRGVFGTRTLRLAGAVKRERTRLFETLSDLGEYLARTSGSSTDAVESLLRHWGPRRLSEFERGELLRLAGPLPPTARALEPFEKLAPGLSMLEIVRAVGLPDADVGSGVHLFLYALADGSSVTIWCTALDQPASVQLPGTTD